MTNAKTWEWRSEVNILEEFNHGEWFELNGKVVDVKKIEFVESAGEYQILIFAWRFENELDYYVGTEAEFDLLLSAEEKSKVAENGYKWFLLNEDFNF